MTQGKRIRELRKSLDLTMEQFGKEIGVTKSTISNIENENRNATEHMVKSICREFNVNYNWLVSGEGDMFNQTDETISDSIDRIMAGENEFHKNLFKTLATLDEKELLSLEKIIDKYLAISNETDS